MATDEGTQFKLWLRALREERGYTQDEVALVLNVDAKTIKNLESPRQGFANGLTILRYLRFLGVLLDAPAETEQTDRLGSLERSVAKAVALTAEILRLNQDAFDELLPLVRELRPAEPRAAREQRSA